MKFHGAFNADMVFPELPFFDYKKSKRFVRARPKPQKYYEKKLAKRAKLFEDPNFIRGLSGMSFEQVAAAMQV
ncbi:hypothetical protein SB5_14680 [Pseudomonas oryzihabitans]|nr:hypothetical protein SB5_14680 [Pseudomonas psychrotolerans]